MIVAIILGFSGRKQKALAKELLTAVTSNQISRVRSILDSNKDNLEFVDMKVEEATGDQNTALGVASFRGYTEIVKLLVRIAQADPDIKDSQEYTATYLAAQEGNFEIVKILVEEANSDINLPNGPDGNTAIIAGIFKGWAGIVNYLIPQVDDINKKNKRGYSPLFVAAQHSSLRIVKDLVSNSNINVNMRNGPRDWTAAMIACEKGALKTLEVLIEGSADPTFTDKHGQSALHIATFNGRTEIIRYLSTQSGVNANEKEESGYTPLFFAAQKGFVDIVKILVEQANADVNSKNGHGIDSMPLTIASFNGHSEIVRYLLNHGAKIHVNYLLLNGYSALAGAIDEGHDDVVKILIEEGNANVELRNEDRLWTALHRAAHEGDLDIVKYLVEDAGANVSARTGDGKDTAQTLAEKNGHQNVAQYLKSIS